MLWKNRPDFSSIVQSSTEHKNYASWSISGQQVVEICPEVTGLGWAGQGTQRDFRSSLKYLCTTNKAGRAADMKDRSLQPPSPELLIGPHEMNILETCKGFLQVSKEQFSFRFLSPDINFGISEPIKLSETTRVALRCQI